MPWMTTSCWVNAEDNPASATMNKLPHKIPQVDSIVPMIPAASSPDLSAWA